MPITFCTNQRILNDVEKFYGGFYMTIEAKGRHDASK